MKIMIQRIVKRKTKMKSMKAFGMMIIFLVSMFPSIAEEQGKSAEIMILTAGEEAISGHPYGEDGIATTGADDRDEQLCLNFPGSSFCSEGIDDIIIIGTDNEGCAIYGCKSEQNNKDPSTKEVIENSLPLMIGQVGLPFTLPIHATADIEGTAISLKITRMGINLDSPVNSIRLEIHGEEDVTINLREENSMVWEGYKITFLGETEIENHAKMIVESVETSGSEDSNINEVNPKQKKAVQLKARQKKAILPIQSGTLYELKIGEKVELEEKFTLILKELERPICTTAESKECDKWFTAHITLIDGDGKSREIKLRTRTTTVSWPFVIRFEKSSDNTAVFKVNLLESRPIINTASARPAAISAEVGARPIRSINPGDKELEIQEATELRQRIHANLREGFVFQVKDKEGKQKDLRIRTDTEKLETFIEGDKTEIKTRARIINKEKKLYISNADGKEKLVKILPDKAAERAREVLGEQFGSIELKDTGKYVVKKTVRGKLFGFISVNLDEEATIDAETGEAKVRKKWYRFFAFKTKEKAERMDAVEAEPETEEK